MKIIKKGNDPSKKEVRFTCRSCGTVFQCTQKEAPKQWPFSRNNDDDPYYKHNCPTCNSYCTAHESDLVDVEIES